MSSPFMAPPLPGAAKAAGRRLVLLLALVSFLAPMATRAPAAGLRVEPLDIVTAHGVVHFKVEIADSPETRAKGLMFRKSLPADGGMLFDFKTPQQVAFWMKNTLIPLDMLFIAADGRIVNIAANAVPMSEAPIPSDGPVLGVLELRGGRAAEIGAQNRDVVRERIFDH